MKQFRHKISYIIPTKDRPEDIKKLFLSFQNQTIKPEQIIVVDGGSESVQNIVLGYKGLNTEYYKLIPPGLTRQRNFGLTKVRGTDLVGFLDDDIVLENDANEKMLEFWEKADNDVIAASFNITNNPICKTNIFTKIFFTNNGQQGAVLKSGYNTILNPVAEDTQVEWVSGGATVWRKNISDNYIYNENIRDFGYGDDVDYSLQFYKKYKLYVVYNARVEHFPIKRSLENIALVEKSVFHARYLIVKKYKHLSELLLFWSYFGRLIMHFIKFLIKHNKEDYFRTKGILQGFLNVLKKKILRKK